MISIFAIPKAFNGHIGVIQRNAIRSWASLRPDVQVILCGDDAGCEQMAREIGADWLGGIARNEFGTPMLDDAFAQAARVARNDVLAYANADIILLPDLLEAVSAMRWSRWLLIGRRVDIDLTDELTASQLAHPATIAHLARERGELHGCGGMDYFVWPRAAELSELPPLAVGRPGWDNYFVQRARYELGLPLIDATAGVLAIHQNHDYRHVSGGDGRSYEGPEARKQRSLLGNVRGSVYDATHCYTPGGLVRAQGFAYRRARWQRRWMTRQLLNAESFVASRTASSRRWLSRSIRPIASGNRAA